MPEHSKKFVHPAVRCFIEKLKTTNLPYRYAQRIRNWSHNPPDYLEFFLDPDIARIAHECATRHSE